MLNVSFLKGNSSEFGIQAADPAEGANLRRMNCLQESTFWPLLDFTLSMGG